MAYTGNTEKDLPSILLNIIAESVAISHLNPAVNQTKTKLLEQFLENRFLYLYKNNKKWAKRIYLAENSRNGSRDAIYMWMNHWATAWVINPARYNKE